MLDAILEGIIDDEKSVAELVAEGFDKATVKKVEHLIYISEYKRFQSAPGTPPDQAQLLAGSALSDREPLAGWLVSYPACVRYPINS